MCTCILVYCIHTFNYHQNKIPGFFIFIFMNDYRAFILDIGVEKCRKNEKSRKEYVF